MPYTHTQTILEVLNVKDDVIKSIENIFKYLYNLSDGGSLSKHDFESRNSKEENDKCGYIKTKIEILFSQFSSYYFNSFYRN